MDALSTIKQYALEDINDALSKLSEKLTVSKMTYDVSGDIESGEGNVVVSFLLTDGKFKFNQYLDYIITSEGDVYAGYNSLDDFAESIKKHYEYAKSGVTASSRLRRKTRIVSADEGEYSTDYDDSDVGDMLSGIADDVEDMQDEFDDIKEDDPTIEVDNNIDGKYIAECERCHGIFISAVSESDQDIESITGTCPLCEHETTQWLNWVINEVER